MNSPPLVSVIIPLYNASEWLEETLKTVLAQTYLSDHLEIIVVDDESSDGSAELARQVLGQGKIRHEIIEIRHAGPSGARNIGWRASQGEWIQFLDADDLLDPIKIEVQIRALAGKTGTAAVYSTWCKYTRVGCSWQGTSLVTPALGDEAVVDLLASENFIQLGSQLFSRGCLEEVDGFNEKCLLVEDVDLLVRIAIAGGHFQYVPHNYPTFYYRQHSASLSRTNASDFCDACVRNAYMVEHHCRATGRLTQYAREVIAEVYYQGCRHYAASNEPKFEQLVRRIEGLLPEWIPERPRSLRSLSRLIGYRRSEGFAVVYRRCKGALTRAGAFITRSAGYGTVKQMKH